ncbi:MAG: type II secretion system minor pseudopilin GspK [Gammaproteobacteria bacterium]|nr:type II secretion system minor pseudopilin GspK [Gammaproteobacteria bacterium]MDH5730640.1 type II secretion system minor pseudopilin GspK [Gammaproteobacteria bacterium]
MKQQAGVALITAILIVALATIAATSVASRQFMDIRRATNVFNNEQLYLYAMAVEAVAMEGLRVYTEKVKYDRIFSPETANEGGTHEFPFEWTFEDTESAVSAKVYDQETKFNVNNLVVQKEKDGNVQWLADTKQKDRFIRILNKVIADLQSEADALQLVDALVDWLDPDSQISGNFGAEDAEYSSLELPYSTANGLLASASELILVQGFTKELLYGKVDDSDQEQPVAIPGLLQYMTALPDNSTTINPNTADPVVLAALSDIVNEEMINTVIADRITRPFKDVATFTDALKDQFTGDDKAEKQGKIAEDFTGLDVQSSYFLAQSTATVGKNSLMLNSLLYRNTTGSNFVIARAIGTHGI